MKIWRVSVPVLVVALDQVSKQLAVAYLFARPPVSLAPGVDLTLVYNSGAAFGFLHDAGGWQNLLFVAVAAAVCVAILVMLRRLGGHEVQAAAALLLVLGGAAGNLIDRLRLGYVVDFIDLYYRSWHWPAFNFADSAITVGAVLLILDGLGWRFGGRRVRPHAN